MKKAPLICWKPEPIIYAWAISPRNTHIAGSLLVPSPVICAQYSNCLGLKPCNRNKLAFLSAQNVSPITYPGEEQEKQVPPSFLITQKDITVRHPQKQTVPAQAEPKPSRLSDVAAGRVDMDAFLAQMSTKELAVLANGYGPGLPFGGFGSQAAPTIFYENKEPVAVCTHPTGSMGYVSPALPKYGIPSIFYKDGPASVGQTAWPTGMLLACSLIRRCSWISEAPAATKPSPRMLTAGSPGAEPAPQSHRRQELRILLEDPVLAGVCGVSVCRGAEENNPVTACPKHFAVNEQETYRRGSARFSFDAVDSILTERAARELYLKPFEMAVRGSHVHTFMSSSTKSTEPLPAAAIYLCTRILREEWGYEGIVVTDWGDMDIVVDGADAAAAGNDIVMPGGPPVIAQVLKGYDEGRVNRQQLLQAAAHLMSTICKTKSYTDYVNHPNYETSPKKEEVTQK